ncbi:MAG: type I glyceraldehyde-3-phosphate dehydrogenase [Flavobacteriales bacterium]|nr:type I glyceraldehyde-3-phosphate dehydrogenase [Flavobacteriales bacterium]|tara:strand:+ start:5825 stop:6808 length:984 start_codon:yes stop_codon:yes gene_type:complete
MKKIAINGFGRIGRVLFRILSQRNDCKVLVINDISSPKVLSHLLKYDSIHGKMSSDIDFGDGYLDFDGQKITILNNPNLSSLDWHQFDIDVVFECTGLFKKTSDLQKHLNAGAKKVILSAPPLDSSVPMVVVGVNDDIITPSMQMISNASCTTNCAAPMIKVLNDNFNVQSAYVTTVHSYTSDQNLHDGVHSDLRRARSAAKSIIPTTTGAAKALSYIFPEIKLGGCGIRVPVSNCSLTDITCVVNENTNIELVNSTFKKSSERNMKNIIEYNVDPIVSVDVTSSSYSCIFDSLLTYVSGNTIKIVGWYDNEYGYCSRLADLLCKIT